MSYYIHVTDAAERDIQEAYDYIDLTLKNPTAADFLTESVGTSLQKLVVFLIRILLSMIRFCMALAFTLSLFKTIWLLSNRGTRSGRPHSPVPLW